MPSLSASAGHWLLLLAALHLGLSPASAEPPLHQRIDELLEQSFTTAPAPRASDATLVRRIHLDLIGQIPSAEETRRFLEDKSPDKWPQLVDRLLADPLFVVHMADQLDVMLMERRADKYVKQPEWRAFLEEAVASNRPFHELAAQILAADGRDETNRGPAKFYLEREAEPNLLTRDIGRVFFGVDLQCAQCHDHPLIDDYYQADYYGIYAFVSRLSMFADKGKKISYLSEKADGEVKFTSVFTDESGKTNPRLLWEQPLGDDPSFAKGEEYEVKPDKNAAGVPKYSRRRRLAEEVGKGENLAFRRNIANRLWAMLMGRGLVHPVDLHHSGNPPAHPELLELLAEEIAAGGFDMKAFLRELALTDAYRRDFALPEDWANRSEQVAEARAAWEAELAQAAEQRGRAEEAHSQTLDAYSAADKLMGEARNQLAPLVEAEAKLAQAAEKAKTAALEAAEQRTNAEARLKPLTDALAATDAAHDASAQDAREELAAILKTLRGKHDVLADAVNKLAADEAAMKSAADTAATNLAEHQRTMTPAREKLDAATAAVERTRLAYRQTEQQIQSARRRETGLQQKLDESQSLLTAAGQLAAVQRAGAEWAAARQAAEPLAKQRDPLVRQLQEMEAEARELDQQLAAERSRQKSLESQLAAIEQPLALLGDATQLVARIDEDVRREAAEALRVIGQRHTQLDQQRQQVSGEMETCTAELAELTARREAVAEKIAASQAELAPLNDKWRPLGRQLTAAEIRLAESEAPLEGAIESVREQWSRRFAMTGLKALTPEQLCWSMLEATGQIRLQTAAALAAINKKAPLSEADQQDATKLAARQREAEAEARKKLVANVATFVKLFAAGAGQPQGEFFATADQALFFRNGPQIRSWIGAGGDSLQARLGKLTDDSQLADELYLAVLTRTPAAEERRDVLEYLAGHSDDRPAAIQDLIWALLTSIEFRFRH